MKVKLDENLPQDLKELLRSLGYDVTDVVEEGLAGAMDPPILHAATEEERLFMTFDTDFADIRHYPPGSHNGIVVFRLKDQWWTAMKGPVRQFIDSGGLEKLRNGLAIVQESSTRYRRA